MMKKLSKQGKFWWYVRQFEKGWKKDEHVEVFFEIFIKFSEEEKDYLKESFSLDLSRK